MVNVISGTTKNLHEMNAKNFSTQRRSLSTLPYLLDIDFKIAYVDNIHLLAKY